LLFGFYRGSSKRRRETKKYTKVTYICSKNKVVTWFICICICIFSFPLIFLSHVFGHFVTTGVKKNQKHQSSYLFLFVRFIWCSICFNCVFGRFATRGVRKRVKKTAEDFPQPPKKVVTYSRHFFFFSTALVMPPSVNFFPSLV
jgi:hypothetical protein